MRRLLFLTLLFLFLPGPLWAAVLAENTIWEGAIQLDDDVVVPVGIKLTIRAGTTVTIKPAESTKIDPEYLSHQTEILVRGNLEVEGSAEAPVFFQPQGMEPSAWAGILVEGGQVSLKHARITQAETALYVLGGDAVLFACQLEKNRYGAVVHGQDSALRLHKTTVRENDYGLLALQGGKIEQDETLLSQNDKQDSFSQPGVLMRIRPQVYELGDKSISRIYKNETVMGQSVWSGRIRIEGQVRVAPEARLLIMPGTIIEFAKRDTNGDGIGENGILVQGVIYAKGTAEAPIIFRSAEEQPKAGDWDSINILGSDLNQNLIEFCQIEHAYRGMHFHFSNVAVTNSVLRKNYRGIQFQESLVEIRNNQFYWNKSALQARDSEVVFTKNTVFNNLNGANLFRLNLNASENIFANNRMDGLRIREGATRVRQNIMLGNRFGLLVADTVFGEFEQNLLLSNLETGLALKNADNLNLKGNAILKNGLNGVNIRDSRAVISENYIADNGERGIGILSFTGQIKENTIVHNGLYGIGLEGESDIDAVGNWWGESDLAAEIFDSHDEPNLGTVTFAPVRSQALPFRWPVASIPADLSWAGEVLMTEKVTVQEGTTLTVTPGTRVRFGPKIGMDVFGTLAAKGSAEARIEFTSLDEQKAKAWDELALDHAIGSVIEFCDFTYATWGIHSHYTDLKVAYSRFMHNDGGLRFRSGPVEVSHSIFTDNRIGIRSYLGIGALHDNDISNNEIGIFIREKGGGLQIHYNNLSENERYNMRLGDFNAEDVDATENWWGEVPVEETIFDGRNETYIGMILFEPQLREKPVISVSGPVNDPFLQKRRDKK